MKRDCLPKSYHPWCACVAQKLRCQWSWMSPTQGPSPSPATSCDLLIERLRGLVSRQVEVDSFWPFHPHWPSLSPAFVLPMLCPAQSSESVRGADDRLESCDPRCGVSLHKSPWGTGVQTGDQVQASGHRTPQRLFFRNQKNVHGKEKRYKHILLFAKALVFNAAPKFRSKAWDLSMCELFGRIHPSVSEQSWKGKFKTSLLNVNLTLTVASITWAFTGSQRSCLHIWPAVGKFLP